MDGGADATDCARQFRNDSRRVQSRVRLQRAWRGERLRAAEQRRGVMDIPYIASVRPDTGVTNQKLGMRLFLAWEVMLFGSLFSSYALLRSGAMSWPEQSSIVSVRLGAVSTVVLIVSGVAILRGVAALRSGNLARFRALMAATAMLGIIFLGIKAIEYRVELAEGLGPSTSNFLGLYFVMTFVHAMHVAGGVLVNLFLCGPGTVMNRHDTARFLGRVEASLLYWNFIGVIWLLLFIVLYLS
jgi:cytochrome c oxidase subunit 3